MMNEERLVEAFRGELDITHSAHPSDALLLGRHLGTLETGEEEVLSLHLATCSQCTARADELRTRSRVWEARPEFLPDPLSMRGLRTGPVWRWPRLVAEKLQVGTHLGWPGWKPVLVHASVYAGVALLIGVTHLALDRVLVSRPSPFATPAKVHRWWVHLYWILLPLGLWFVWRLRAHGGSWRRRDDSQQNRR